MSAAPNETTETRLLGGNLVTQVAPIVASLDFADGPYYYGCRVLQSGQAIILDGFEELVVFCRQSSDGARVQFPGGKKFLGAGASVEFRNQGTVELTAEGGEVTLLVVGLRGEASGAPDMTVIEAGAHYKVVKPWGHELWINGDHPRYVLKEIAIKAGTKTSLQYHNFKEETIVMFEGRATFVYKENAAVANDNVAQEDLGEVVVEPLVSIHVTPGVLHRMCADTDVLLYEVSTPFLDDVVRVSDDTARPDGNISAEHGGKR